MRARLRPTLTMSDIYGPAHIFFPRALTGHADWLPNAPHQLDSFTGGQLVVAGEMPIVCSQGFNSPAAVELLALSGLEMGASRMHFRAGEDEDALSRAMQDEDTTLILSHALPEGTIEESRCWIDQKLLRYLNNKANLADLCRPESTPSREVIDRAEHFADTDHRFPVVLKAASEQSSGGGCAVMVCRSGRDVDEAARLFESCEQIVVEEMLDIERNPCLNFAVMPDGEVRYLGFADQDLSPEGKYRGNWLDASSPIPQAGVDAAMEPVRRAAEMGYRGFAGVDIAVTADGRILVLDLNFRVNGCTVPLLLAPAIRERNEASMMHFRTIRASTTGEELARALTPFVAGERVVPLNLFDPELAGYPDKPASVQALILGASRRDILEIEAEMAKSGIN